MPRQRAQETISAPTPLRVPQPRTASASEWITAPVRRPSPASVADFFVVAAPDVLAVLVAVVLVGPIGLVAALGAVVWAFGDLYRRRSHLSVLDDVPAATLGVLVGINAMVLIDGVTKLQAVEVGLAMLGVMVVGRALGYALVRSRRRHGRWIRHTVVLGTGEGVQSLVARIGARRESGLHVGAVLGSRAGVDVGGVRSSGRISDLPDLLESGEFDTVVVGNASELSEAELADVVRSCAAARLEVFVTPRLPELYHTRRGDDHVWGVPLRRVAKRWTPMRRAAKRVLDVTASAVALVMIAPVLAVVALMVRLDGPGILFRQERIGRDGHPFHLLKFRSMRPLREGETAAWAVDADRYGRFGKFLRRYSLDELPQLVNVLMGDMSLVGPRPERPEYVALFGAQIFSYRHRHRVTVGLTGLAAVEGLRGDSSIDERARFDNWYIENWSLWLDMKILVRTVVAVLKGSGS